MTDQKNKMKYYTEDITWCSKNNCDRVKCERNQKHIRPALRNLSFADLEYTDYCPKKRSDNNV